MEGKYIISQVKIHANPLMKNVVELHSFIKSIPIDDNIGKEIVLLVTSNIMNNKTFFTDSNGLELQKRILNYRPTWDLDVKSYFSYKYSN